MQGEAFYRRAKELVRALWHIYLIDRTPENFRGLSNVLHEDLALIGTGKHELYQSLQQFLASLASDQQDVQDILFEIVDEWYAVQPITETVCVVYGTFWAREKTKEHRQRLIADMDTRFSVVCRARGDGISVLHVHHSVPSRDQMEGEFYPKSMLQQANEMLERYAILEKRVHCDSLTGLYNRDYAQTCIQQMLQKWPAAAFWMMDIDHFKRLNDHCGHPQGDAALCFFAKQLSRYFDECDCVARVGGDEFAVLMHSPGGVEVLGEKARALIQAFVQGLPPEQQQLGVSLSIGIALAPRDGTDFRTLYVNADRALYYAKAHRKGSHAFYSDI